jgi:GTP-binding protein HflX
VGYTNAGKSTLFNRLTNAGVVADSRMFATLDPTVRQLTLPSNRRVLLSDTVGFIRNLPTTLVRAFRATLEEVTEASLLLHVIDVSSPHAAQFAGHVGAVLREIGAESTPQILVLNKTDLLPGDDTAPEAVRQRLLGQAGTGDKPPGAVAVSARTGKGVEDLLRRIDNLLPVDPLATVTFRIPHSEGAAAHLVHEYARVIDRRDRGEYSEVLAEAPESIRKRLARFLMAAPEADRAE